jgi:hypothetical protein
LSPMPCTHGSSRCCSRIKRTEVSSEGRDTLSSR